MSVARRVAKNTVFLSIGQIVWTLFSIALLLFSARILGVEDFGYYTFAFAFVLLFSILTDFGFDNVVVRELARNPKLVGKYVQNLLAIKLLFSLVAFLAITAILLMWNLPPYVVYSTLLLGLYVIFNSLSSLPKCVFRSFEKMQYEALLTGLSKFLALAFGIPLLVLGYGLLGLAFAFFLAGFITLLVSFFLMVSKFTPLGIQFDFQFWKSVILESLPFALTAFFSTFSGKITTVLLGLLQSNLSVGIYSAAYKFLEGLTALPTLIVLPVYPLLSRYFISSKTELEKTYYFTFKLLFVFVLPLSFGVSLLAAPFIHLLYGAAYAESVPVLQILIWSIFFTFLTAVSQSVVFAANQQAKIAGYALVSAIVNVIVCLALIPLYASLGAAVAVLFSAMVLFAFSFYCAHQIVPLPKLDFVYKSFLASLAMSAVLLYSPVQKFFVLVVLGFLSYFAILLLVKGIDGQDIALLKKMLKLTPSSEPLSGEAV